jgi:hypothetical protein
MNFGSGSAKAWKDIWGAGQGVGAIKRVVPAAELVRRFVEEYALARRRLGLACRRARRRHRLRAECQSEDWRRRSSVSAATAPWQ